MGFKKFNDEKWIVNDRDGFSCVRHGYDIVTVDKREYVANMRWEEDAEYVVKIHNQYLDEKKTELC
jgi:hypothetical protein